MTTISPHIKGTADIGPGTLLFHGETWRDLRRKSPGAYVVGIPRDNHALRSIMLDVANRLRRKGLPVMVVEISGSPQRICLQSPSSIPFGP